MHVPNITRVIPRVLGPWFVGALSLFKPSYRRRALCVSNPTPRAAEASSFLGLKPLTSSVSQSFRAT